MFLTKTLKKYYLIFLFHILKFKTETRIKESKKLK